MMNNDWKKMSIKEVLSAVVDNRGKTPPTQDKGFALLEVNAISPINKFPLYGAVRKHVSKEVYLSHFRSGHPKIGDVLIPTVGTLGAVSFVNRKDCCIAQNVIAIRANKNIMENDFLYYTLRNPFVQKRLLNLDIGGVQPSIKVPHLMNLIIDVPPLNIQKAISRVLSVLDSKIEQNTAINNNLEQQAQALLTDFLGHTPIPYKLLTDIAVIKYGKGLATKNLLDSGYPVFGGNGIIGRYSDYLYKEPQILISCRGAASGNIMESLPYSYVTSNSLVVELADRKYYEIIKRFLMLHPLHSYATGSAQPQITIDNLKNVSVPYPEMAELNKITPLFENFAQKSLQIYTENERLAEIRDALLPKLMSGEIDVSKVDISDPSCLDKSLFNCVEG